MTHDVHRQLGPSGLIARLPRLSFFLFQQSVIAQAQLLKLRKKRSVSDEPAKNKMRASSQWRRPEVLAFTDMKEIAFLSTYLVSGRLIQWPIYVSRRRVMQLPIPPTDGRRLGFLP